MTLFNFTLFILKQTKKEPKIASFSFEFPATTLFFIDSHNGLNYDTALVSSGIALFCSENSSLVSSEGMDPPTDDTTSRYRQKGLYPFLPLGISRAYLFRLLSAQTLLCSFPCIICSPECDSCRSGNYTSKP